MTQPPLLEPSCPLLPPPARLGEIILGKYRLDRILGRGGMGVVVRATHLQLGQPIAIKFMSPLLAENDREIQRFVLEARAAARIRSEHVARVFDVDMLPSGPPYIVMEYLDGEDLSTMLKRLGRLDVPEAVAYVLQACEAIAEAHAVGIVHRDLKPGNLFCCRRPDGAPLIKVLDFGVSKLLANSDATLRGIALTGPQVVLGTPLYASPEQLRLSADVDARTDIWALGVILYELISGKSPFQADSFPQICAKVVHMPYQPLGGLRPEVSEELCAAVARCLAKDRDERFPTVAHLAEALAPHAPRGSLLSVERAEKILHVHPRPRGDDPTLRSPAPYPEPPVLAPEPPVLAPQPPVLAPEPPALAPEPPLLAAAATVRYRILFRPRLLVAVGWVAAGVLAVALILALVGRPSPTAGSSVSAPPWFSQGLRASATASPPAAPTLPSRPEPEPEPEPEPAPTRPAASIAPAPPPEPAAVSESAASAAPPPPRRPAAPRRAPGTSEFGGLL
jgi:serine/threonine-protein kinase